MKERESPRALKARVRRLCRKRVFIKAAPRRAHCFCYTRDLSIAFFESPGKGARGRRGANSLGKVYKTDTFGYPDRGAAMMQEENRNYKVEYKLYEYTKKCDIGYGGTAYHTGHIIWPALSVKTK
jgi:hypothetical protein